MCFTNWLVQISSSYRYMACTTLTVYIVLHIRYSFFKAKFRSVLIYSKVKTWFEEVLLRVKEQRNILHEIHKRKANWIGHISRRNCLLQRVTEGKIKGGIEVTGRQGRRRMKLLDDLKERRGYSHLKEEALDRTMWRAHFGRGFGPVVRQTTKWMNSFLMNYISKMSYWSMYLNQNIFQCVQVGTRLMRFFWCRPIQKHN